MRPVWISLDRQLLPVIGKSCTEFRCASSTWVLVSTRRIRKLHAGIPSDQANTKRTDQLFLLVWEPQREFETLYIGAALQLRVTLKSVGSRARNKREGRTMLISLVNWSQISLKRN